MKTETPRSNNSINAQWIRTELVHNRLQGNPNFIPPNPSHPEAPYGIFANRKIIGSGMTNIIGGVYLGARAREAIVVDDQTNSEGDKILRGFYEQEFKTNLESKAARIGYLPKQLALNQIFKTVLKKMPYDDAKVKLLIQQLTQGEQDKKVHLSSFLLSGVGVCRQQALLVGYLLEKLKQEQRPELKILGTFSIERNAIAFENEGREGAHVWVRYTGSSGQPWIIDVTQKKIGRLEELMQQRSSWEYARPHERILFERSHPDQSF
ncbi:hypothetical protein IT408_01060 [Candidatus Uhrbacteria bacterium]|nr:hypothetical protein [Candidatus Uhrbacteria bacterium]